MKCEYSGTSIFLTNFLSSYGMRMQASISTDDLRLDKGDDTDWRVTDWPTAAAPRLLPPTTLRCGRRARPSQDAMLAYYYNYWRFHDNTILVKEDGELKNWVVPNLLIFVPYCCYCLTLSVALISTVVWVPIAWHSCSASGPQQLRGCGVQAAGERSINLKCVHCPELDTSADVCNFKHILKLDKAWSMKQTA